MTFTLIQTLAIAVVVLGVLALAFIAIRHTQKEDQRKALIEERRLEAAAKRRKARLNPTSNTYAEARGVRYATRR